jgi:signal peptidase I
MASNNKAASIAMNIFLGVITLGLYFLLRKSDTKKSKSREWIDAILFAVIAATIIRTFLMEAFTIPTSSMEKSLLIGDFLFVSKVSYGPRIPNTPLSFPFAHHTMPLTDSVKSYLEWIKLPYLRLPGLGKIKNNDVVVFNYPMEDFRPVDKQENYIKRCVGIPGDVLEVKEGVLWINNVAAEKPEKIQHKYHVKTDGTDFNAQRLEEMNITEGSKISNQGDYELTLTPENADKIKEFANVTSVTQEVAKAEGYTGYLFPEDTTNKWSVDNYGPVSIPKRDVAMQLNMSNIAIYKRAIEVYEHNKVEIKDSSIYINDQKADSYTFKMDYYWMMGDNRHNSADSRFWGFVPEDHIVGKAVFVWLSLSNTANSIFNKIRFNRMFSFINDKGVSKSYLPHGIVLIGLIWGASYLYRRRKGQKA